MLHKSTRIALRWFFRLEIICLCVILAGVGSAIAADRTAYTAQGAPAAVQTDKPVPPVLLRLPDRAALASLTQFAPLLPAPTGNLVSVLLSFQNFYKNSLSGTFGKLHSFLRSF